MQQSTDSDESSPAMQGSPNHHGHVVNTTDQEEGSRVPPKSAVESTTSHQQLSNSLLEAQEAMLNMKSVDGRTSTLNLSQVSLKQKDVTSGPRTKSKQRNNTNISVRLQIEGQCMKHSPEATQQSHTVPASTRVTATRREQRVNAAKSSATAAHEAKSERQISLMIRPISLQQHSRGQTGATTRSVNHKQNIDKKTEKSSDVDVGETKDTTAVGGPSAVASDSNNTTGDAQAKREDSFKGQSAEEINLPAKCHGKADPTLETSTSTECQSVKDDEADGQAKELHTETVTAVANEVTETSNSSVSQDMPPTRDTPKSPTVAVKAPLRPHPNRPTSSTYARKSR